MCDLGVCCVCVCDLGMCCVHVMFILILFLLDFPRERVPVVLMPLIYREQLDITEDRYLIVWALCLCTPYCWHGHFLFLEHPGV